MRWVSLFKLDKHLLNVEDLVYFVKFAIVEFWIFIVRKLIHIPFIIAIVFIIDVVKVQSLVIIFAVIDNIFLAICIQFSLLNLFLLLGPERNALLTQVENSFHKLLESLLNLSIHVATGRAHSQGRETNHKSLNFKVILHIGHICDDKVENTVNLVGRSKAVDGSRLVIP
jgi:hypothetical protein